MSRVVKWIAKIAIIAKLRIAIAKITQLDFEPILQPCIWVPYDMVHIYEYIFWVIIEIIGPL